MNEKEKRRKIRRERTHQAIAINAIEGIHFTEEDNALFEMFDREDWSDEKIRSYLISMHTQVEVSAPDE